MSGIKASELDLAGALGENDLLYIVRQSAEGGLESKKTTIGTLVGLLSGGLPDLTVVPDHEAKTPEDFAQWVEERFIEEVPDKATNHTVYITMENGESLLGTVTKFPTAAGCYYWVCGYNAIGQMTLDDILYYVSTDLPGARWPVGHISVPKAEGGGNAGWPDLVVNNTGETKTPEEFYLWVNGFFGQAVPSEAINHTVMVKEPDSQQSSMGSMTIIPTANGCYYWMCGPNALGNGDVAEALMYTPTGGNTTVLTYLTIPKGGAGAPGKDGNSITLKGSFEKYSDLPLPESNTVGDSWFVQTTLYSWDGSNWTNLGDFAGPQGSEGPMGAMVTIVGPYPSYEELVADVSVNVNSIATVGKNFYYFDGSAWNLLGDFSGPKGDKGDPGTSTFKASSGNWATNYPNNLANDDAHGVIGNSEYWKTTYNLDKATYNKYPVVNAYLQTLPCDENGAILPHNFYYYFNSAGMYKPPNIVMMLIVYGTATQLLDTDSGTYGPLGIVDNVSYSPHWSLSYWY